MGAISAGSIREHPLPWIFHESVVLEAPCIRDFNNDLVLAGKWGDTELFKFIVTSINAHHEEKWDMDIPDIDFYE